MENIWRELWKKLWEKVGSASAGKRWTLSITRDIKWTGYHVGDLILKRKWYTDKSTIGELYFGDEFVCFTLEDTLRRGVKVAGETAIPSGKYEVIVNYSNRFKKMMPLLLDVPEFTGVRIHSGNTSDDTLGCILVGLEKGEDVISRSRDAFNLLFPRIQDYVSKEKLFISISNLGKEIVQ